jgi:hypothetical protein
MTKEPVTMSDERHTQPTFDQLAQQVQAQQRQIATLATMLTAAQPARSDRAVHARRLGAGSVIAMILALLFGTVALAASPGAGGAITGCYTQTNGALRVIDSAAGQTCTNKELQLTWSQTGPQGLTGATGATGAAGPQGLPGVAGPKGDTGPQGLTGSQGLPGVAGPKGDPGAPGAQGPAGPKGLNWRDEWLPDTIYQPGDAVYSGGASFIATQTTSEQPGPRIELGIPWGILSLRGTQGPQGAQGVPGPAGTAGISGYQIIEQQSNFDSSSVKGFSIACPAGKHAIAGGADIFPSLADPNRDIAPVVLKTSVVGDGAGTAWFAQASEIAPYSFNWDLTVTAICANVAP